MGCMGDLVLRRIDVNSKYNVYGLVRASILIGSHCIPGRGRAPNSDFKLRKFVLLSKNQRRAMCLSGSNSSAKSIDIKTNAKVIIIQ